MRIIGKILFICLLLQLLEKAKATKRKVDFCHIRVIMIRVMCHPLQHVWIERHGRCVRGFQCVKGYTQSECEKNCLNKQTTTTKTTTQMATIITTTASTTESPNTTANNDLDPDRSTRRPPRTRRTRKSTVLQ
ncbi:uncharacterized protein Dwil_GK27854 [Drosophila willistoni]|uniref:BPTI/Kunitz inhibitor domain-containing protein n=1 Tax=Drosophila willistoni TaxID=7260 RepID=A0A0Q9WSF2_DROWI|nr:uncharacterized protein Dwil_GK27854 [Drosophila willistoni]